MAAIHCPYCGMQRADAATRERVPGGDSSFVCPGCGKAVEPPLAGNSIPAPPQHNAGGDNRWSEGPPEDSANRWSVQPPLGDESSSSGSVSQSSILPTGEPDQPLLVRPARSPLVWALIVLVIFLAALIGVVMSGALGSALACRAEGRRPAGNGRILAAAIGARRRRSPARGRPGHRGPGPRRRLPHLGPHLQGSGQRARFPARPRRGPSPGRRGAEAVPGLCECLRSPQPKIRAAAVEVLQQMGAAGRTRAIVCSPPSMTRTPGSAITRSTPWAILAPTEGPPPSASPSSLPRRIVLLHGGSAIEALGRIGPEARDAVGALEKAAADDPDLTIRSSASLALKQVEVEQLARKARREASGEMRPWLKALDGDDTPAAIAAAEALGNLEFKGQPAAPGLALMLRHADRQRRLAAAAALGHLGLAATDFVPTLEAAAKEEDAEVRAAAAKALEPPGGKQP